MSFNLMDLNMSHEKLKLKFCQTKNLKHTKKEIKSFFSEINYVFYCPNFAGKINYKYKTHIVQEIKR